MHQLSLAVILFTATVSLGLFDSQRARAADEPLVPPVLLQMVRDPAIHHELNLSASQIDQVMEATDAIDPILWPSRILPVEQRAKITDELSARLWAQLVTILDAEQRDRMTQLQRQATGTRMLLRPEVADLLKLTPTVREKIRSLALETDAAASGLQQRLQEGGKMEEIAAETEKLKDRERKGIVALLTPQQQQQIGQLVGQPFNFAQVQRTNPRAPELVGSAQQWVQGTPQSMRQLRGKVVVIHFYAFQCINCRRNLPHYNGWYDDFSSDDVVVIGIQTPETAAERDAEKVTAALESEGISYPVLFDPESENWKAWGNTMWPTVYLVDREGFIRTWWQGELNWQGATGEQQYRQYIRQLVAE
jgi:peroxiredoxin